MAREGLRRELTGALHHAVAHREAVRREGLRVKTNGDFATINLMIRPVSPDVDAATAPSRFLVVFEPAQVNDKRRPEEVAAADSGAGTAVADAHARIEVLEQELHTREEYLQTINEELETSNEELQSSNEELQSVNEELQSTIEELETSKEELQSVNEELATINAELQTRVGDLQRANNDISNLLSGTGIGTIFVDHHLRILRFTPTITEVINLIPGDVGRAVGHIVTNLVGYDRLVADAQDVLRTLIPREVEVQTQAGTWYMLRIHPYRTQENVIEGAVITFFDISELKQMQEALRESSMEMQALAARLDVAREEERAAVAWELHDEIAQALAIVRDTLRNWSSKSPSEVLAHAQSSLKGTVRLLDTAIERLRGLYANLVPVMLEDLDLASTIEWQVDEFARHSQLHCEAGTVDAVVLIDTRTSLGLFRVLQEWLENAAQHPGATRVTVDLVREGDHALLRVTDDDRAVSGENCMKPGTPELVSIRARVHSWGGSVKLQTTVDGNTVLEVTAPLLAEPLTTAAPPSPVLTRTGRGKRKASVRNGAKATKGTKPSSKSKPK
jgi:signal transduction histidine kinase